MAQNLPADGKVYALEVSQEFADFSRPAWKEAGVEDRIELMLNPAVDSMEEILKSQGENSIDMVFIDADKHNYDNYYELGLKLVRPNGLILVDNTLWFGKVIDEKDQSEGTNQIRAINEKIASDSRVQIAFLGMSDG